MDYEKLICRSLQNRLGKEVKGEIEIAIEDDVLHIVVSQRGTRFEYKESDMARRVLYGLNAELISYDFCKRYRNFILRGYFK